MDQVEKLSRLRLTKRNKRKLSLPSLLNQFHLQWDADSQRSVSSSKLEAIKGTPVRQFHSSTKSHSTPSSTEKVGRSHSLSSTGELEVIKKFKKFPRQLVPADNFEERSPCTEAFKKCSRRLETTDNTDVFSPSKTEESQNRFGKLSFTSLSPIPVCDSWLKYTSPPSLKYHSPTNIQQKEVGSGETNDCENEAEYIDCENHEVSSQNMCQSQTSCVPFSFHTKKREKSLLKRKRGIRRSSRGVPSNNQNCSSKDEDDDNENNNKAKTKLQDQEQPEIQDGEILSNTKNNECSKGLMTIIEFLKDPLSNPSDLNKGTCSRTSLPVETALLQSSGDGYRTPVECVNDVSQPDGSALRIKGLDSECFQTIGKNRSNKSPMLTPKRKGVQKKFPWTSTTDESITLLDYEKIDRSEIIGFSKEGPLKGIRESKKNKRWSSIFPTSDEDVRMDLLSQKLDFYSKNGLVKFHTSSINHKKYKAPNETLESSWQCIVDSPELLSKQRRQQQSTIWELVTTEVTYLNTLKVIVNIFRSCLVNLQNDLLMTEIDTQKLFSNIQDIYAANLVLWHEHIVKMLEFSRTTGQPLDPTFLFDAFCKVSCYRTPHTEF
ncbi:unnamed protein product, partial [Meganyctiphanes norvegica]